MRYQILVNPSVDTAVLWDELRGSGELSAIEAIVRNPQCPKEILEIVSEGNVIAFKEHSEETREIDSIRSLARERLTGIAPEGA